MIELNIIMGSKTGLYHLIISLRRSLRSLYHFYRTWLHSEIGDDSAAKQMKRDVIVSHQGGSIQSKLIKLHKQRSVENKITQ